MKKFIGFLAFIFLFTLNADAQFWVKKTRTVPVLPDSSEYVLSGVDSNMVWISIDSALSFRDTLVVQTMADSTNDTIAIETSVVFYDPASLIAADTITLPDTAVNGKILQLYFGGTIDDNVVLTSLVIRPNGSQKIIGTALTTASSGSHLVLRYREENNSWYIVSKLE